MGVPCLLLCHGHLIQIASVQERREDQATKPLGEWEEKGHVLPNCSDVRVLNIIYIVLPVHLFTSTHRGWRAAVI